MRVILVIICCLYGSVIFCQTSGDFKPFPGNLSDLYQFDLHKNYFINDDVEYRDRKEMIAAFQRLEKKLEEAKTKNKNVHSLLYEFDSLQKKMGKHSAYLGMYPFINTADPLYQMKLDSLSQQINPLLTHLGEIIMSLPKSAIGPYYEFFYTQLQNTTPFSKFSPGERRILNDITPNLINWQPRLFQINMRSSEFKPVETPTGKKYLPANINEVFNSPDRNIRKQGFLNNMEGIKSRREILAFLLLETVRNRNRVAVLSDFKDFPEQYYAGRFLTTEDVKGLLKILKDSAYINKRYETALFENFKKIGKFDTVYAWDRYMPDPNAPTPRFTITEATNIILEATKPLGNEYYTEIAKLLDPKNGRLDMVMRPNRVQRPGFSNGSVGYNSLFFQGNYEGYLYDVIIFGHEAGHAVQNMLMDNNHVSSFYAMGASYFTESFAGFNELLISDYLYRNASSKELKKYYLARFLEDATAIFGHGMDTYYQQTLYDSIQTGKFNNADQLEAQMQQVGLEFSRWYEPHMKYEMQWVNKMQFTTNPLYSVNYLYAKLLAVYYFSLYEQDKNSFLSKYNELLRNGYDQEPDKILKRFFNISVKDKKLVDITLNLINQKIGEYEKLTK